jgi:predicted metal-dependent enzyme (double-stranded beta helix superfamily)
VAVDTTTQNAQERFISKMRDLFARESDLDKRWSAVPPILEELLADPRVQEASKGWPVPSSVPTEPGERRGGNLLFYEDPDFGFVINGQIHADGRQQGEPKTAHDHGKIYTAYGVLEGHERIVQFERTDDRSLPDHAEVKKTGDYLAGPGDIHLAGPGDIHVEMYAGERTAAVIIRSKRDGIPANLHGRYDLETNSYHESIGPRQILAEMLPGKGR